MADVQQGRINYANWRRYYRALLPTIFIISLTACDQKPVLPTFEQESKLQFTCTQEADHLPPLDPQADTWFQQARTMQKASGPKDYAAIGALYRQAAAKDHYKALINLQNMLRNDSLVPKKGKTEEQEVIAINEQLIKLNIPAGYYARGIDLQQGYGVERDTTAALSYFRKSADLGNPEAQYIIGDLMTSELLLPNQEPNPVYRPEIGKKILACAANQGNFDAAWSLAETYRIIEHNYPLALKYYQLAIKNGNDVASSVLESSFNGPLPSDELSYQGLSKDPERVRRYKLISDELDRHPSARFPDIDKIVPLPPAALPEWDGTFEYKKGK